MQKLQFTSSKPFTLGIEIELQLVDPKTWDLKPVAESILDLCQDIPNIKPEIFQSMIEINSSIHNNAVQAERELKDISLKLTQICDSLDTAICSAGTHPSALHWERKIYPSPRFAELIERNQFISRRLMIFGLHVHLGARSGEHCIQMNNSFHWFLPHLLALSSSSPFWEGIDTGLSSSRTTIFEAIPTGGHPCLFKDWTEFEDLVNKLEHSKAITSLKDIWWDMRPSPGYGTLEIRICDSLSTIHEAAAIAALAQCLAMGFESLPEKLSRNAYKMEDWIVRENKWRAARHGMDAEIIVAPNGDTRLLRDDLLDLLDILQPIGQTLGYDGYFSFIRDVVKKNNPSAERQKRVFLQTNSLEDVTRELVHEFREDLRK